MANGYNPNFFNTNDIDSTYSAYTPFTQNYMQSPSNFMNKNIGLGGQNNGFGLNRESMFGGAQGGGWLTGGAQALGSLGQLWSGINEVNLAKDQFNFTKDYSNRNLANTATSYNTRLEDMVNARNAAYGTDRVNIDREAYLAQNRVSGEPI